WGSLLQSIELVSQQLQICSVGAVFRLELMQLLTDIYQCAIDKRVKVVAEKAGREAAEHMPEVALANLQGCQQALALYALSFNGLGNQCISGQKHQQQDNGSGNINGHND